MPPQSQSKVVLVGDSGVGKSTILSRFRGERYNPCYVQTREREIKSIQVQVSPRKTVGLQIWDTPGSDQCRTITAAYVRSDVRGAIVVFDVSNDDSYHNVPHWVRTIKEYTGDDGIPFVFVGNKSDKESLRKVRVEQGNQMAEQYNADYFDTSAKTNQNINEVFKKMAESLSSSSNGGDSLPRIEENPDNGGFCTVL